jgi:regulator of protease activity HflC (stomatin/prohibitin superfamily)
MIEPRNGPKTLTDAFEQLSNEFQEPTEQNSGNNVPHTSQKHVHSVSFAQEGGKTMINYISGLVFTILLIAGGIILFPLWMTAPGFTLIAGIIWLTVASIISSAIQLAAQWEKAVVFRLGKFSAIKGPGIFLIIPLIDQLRMIDMRVLTMDIPAQQVITKDNVPVKINGVIFFKVDDAGDAIIKVQDYRYAISQYAQTSLRDVIGQMTLDQLLSEREEIGKKIETTVEKDTAGWGLEVTGIRMQDIDMPEDLKRMMSRQASAEREKRANITKAEGDKLAAVNLAEAARIMTESTGAMQLRTLQTIDGLGPTASNTVVLTVPINVMEIIDQVSQKLKASNKPAAN